MTLSEIIKSVQLAEHMAPHGSHAQGELLKAALLDAWPKIKVVAELGRLRQSRADQSL